MKFQKTNYKIQKIKGLPKVITPIANSLWRMAKKQSAICNSLWAIRVKQPMITNRRLEKLKKSSQKQAVGLYSIRRLTYIWGLTPLSAYAKATEDEFFMRLVLK